MTDTELPEPDHASTVEEAIAVRLARLAERRAASKPEAPKPTVPTAPKKKRRRHAALGSRGITLIASVGASVAMTLVFARAHGTQAIAPTGIVTVGPEATTGSAPTAPTTNADSTVINGDAFTNKWGPVQVQVTFGADGTITDVAAIATPSRDNKGVRINDQAVPILNREALTAQSAQVDTVSGATYTSTDYKRSLQSAIDAAHAAGVLQ